jgi:hypothetical protein
MEVDDEKKSICSKKSYQFISPPKDGSLSGVGRKISETEHFGIKLDTQ